MMREINYATAVGEALREEMERDESVFLIGEDLGSVREAEDLFAEFRRRRVWQTPISESGFTGLAVGAAAVGLRPVVEIMYCDFVTVCMDMICNQAAKLHLMSGGSVKLPMVIRTPAGCGTREGAHHSQSLEAWFMHTPGLKVVMPSTPYDAKGLFKAAIRDDGPVVFIQHRLLHPTTQEVPDGDWTVPLGVADVKREGKDLTVVAYSYGLHKAMQAAEALNNEISVEIVDPRTSIPSRRRRGRPGACWSCTKLLSAAAPGRRSSSRSSRGGSTISRPRRECWAGSMCRCRTVRPSRTHASRRCGISCGSRER
jgi:pyruvate/2-oxoglutarate/acetoin dehydrogenase E1 component